MGLGLPGVAAFKRAGELPFAFRISPLLLEPAPLLAHHCWHSEASLPGVAAFMRAEFQKRSVLLRITYSIFRVDFS